MSYLVDCFDYIIGLSRTDCGCYSPPADYDISDSGLYLDELIPLHMFNGALNCDEGTNLFTYMDKARQNAIIAFRNEGNMKILKGNRLKRKPFYGTVGKLKTTRTKTLTTGNWYGVRVFCADIVSGIFRVKQIGTLFDTTGTLTLQVYNNLNENIASYNLNTTANTHVLNNITDLELDMHSGYVDNLEYFFVFQADGTKSPLNNQLTGDCESLELCFNVNNACCYRTQTNKQYGFADFSMWGSFARSSVADLSDLPSVASEDMYGLTFDVEFVCKYQDVWCLTELDYEADNLAMLMAEAVRYKAGSFLINEVLSSQNLNRNVLINHEELLRQQDIFEEAYDEMLTTIVDNLDIERTDCFECKEQLGFGLNTIWS